MRQRLHIARGLLHDPPVIFLDEPTIGVDPVGARELRATIADLKAAGKTVLLTTHYMFEADALCDRIAVVAKGQIVAEGTPRELKDRVSEGVVVEIEVYGIEDGRVEALRAIEGVTSVAVEDRDQAQVVVVQAELRPRADARRPRAAGRRLARPRDDPRADARGRVRRARHRAAGRGGWLTSRPTRAALSHKPPGSRASSRSASRST